MPISLTTALNTGDIDSAVYDHVLIAHQSHDAIRKMITLVLEYGTIVDNTWAPGEASPAGGSEFPSSLTLSGAEYLSIISHASNDGELTYNAVKRGLYEYLQSNYIKLAGSIVSISSIKSCRGKNAM